MIMSTDFPQMPNVLVVEDEMILRMRAVEIVEDAGFNPVDAVNADQAISILESRSDISLLVYRHSNARQYRRLEACPCGARPLAVYQDHTGFGSGKPIGIRKAGGQPILRQTPWR